LKHKIIENDDSILYNGSFDQDENVYQKKQNFNKNKLPKFEYQNKKTDCIQNITDETYFDKRQVTLSKNIANKMNLNNNYIPNTFNGK
jgi:hypothetical protein